MGAFERFNTFSDNLNLNLQGTSNYISNNLTGYLSPASIIEAFEFKAGFEISTSPFLYGQSFLRLNTADVTLQLQSFTHNPLNVFQYSTDYLLNDTISINTPQVMGFYKNLSSNIITELSILTTPRTNFDELIRVLPDYEDMLELFEVLSVNEDNSLYHHLYLPEFKLYYPEPYIASPSFNHEELWFIHILHYQHWLWFFFHLINYVIFHNIY